MKRMKIQNNNRNIFVLNCLKSNFFIEFSKLRNKQSTVYTLLLKVNRKKLYDESHYDFMHSERCVKHINHIQRNAYSWSIEYNLLF